MKILLMTPPGGKSESGKDVVLNFIEVLEPLCHELLVITGKLDKATLGDKKSLTLVNIKKRYDGDNLLLLALQHAWLELRVAYQILRFSRRFDIVIFYLGMGGLILPALIAKGLGKKVVFVANGSLAQSARKTYKRRLLGLGPALFSRLFALLETINYMLADQLSAQSERAISFLGLDKYGGKYTVNGAMYINTDSVTIKKQFKNRRNVIGYIGRLSEEKGVINFVRAIPLLSKRRSDVEFLIVGDGPLKDEIVNELKQNGCGEKVTITGWVPAGEVPDYLNELKLLVLPSETEGLPATIQQAMACGTPVLATPVGGVPDLIEDGKTGFLLGNNSPECIAQNVSRALQCPNLREIIPNARKLIENEYAYEPIVAKCKVALNKLTSEDR